MKISELNDETVLNFLMTSDFNEQDYSPSELKYLLVKWRYFYRLSQGRNEQIKKISEGDIQNLNNDIEILNSKNYSLSVMLDEKELTISSMKQRDLTWRERLYGRIILKDK
jgi:hypothetical protein